MITFKAIMVMILMFIKRLGIDTISDAGGNTIISGLSLSDSKHIALMERLDVMFWKTFCFEQYFDGGAFKTLTLYLMMERNFMPKSMNFMALIMTIGCR